MGFETSTNYYHKSQLPTFPMAINMVIPSIGDYLYHHGHRYGYHLTTPIHMPINDCNGCQLLYYT